MNAYHFITRYRERAEAFARRSISTLEKIDFSEDFNQETSECYNKLVQAGYDDYTAYENTKDLEASLALEYCLLNDGIYTAVLMSFYHLWERDIRDLCKLILRYYEATLTSPKKTKKVTAQEIANFKFEDFKSFFAAFGLPAEHFKDINLLRLIVNTAKHSSGPSANELKQLDSQWYCKLSNMCDLDDFPDDEEPTVSAHSVTIEDVKHFEAVINVFWAGTGNHRRFHEMHL